MATGAVSFSAMRLSAALIAIVTLERARSATDPAREQDHVTRTLEGTFRSLRQFQAPVREFERPSPSHGATNDRQSQSPENDVRNDARTTALSDQ
jgi:hypothetical protein